MKMELIKAKIIENKRIKISCQTIITWLQLGGTQIELTFQHRKFEKQKRNKLTMQLLFPIESVS